MIDLKNLNILLTGATGVIGNSILERVVSAGSNVLATGSNEEKLKKIKDKYKNVNILKFDISKHKNIEEFVENCNSIFSNKIDVLINNAGITQDNLSIRMKEEEWKKVIDINLSSTFFITKNVIKKMLKSRKGKIINVTSVVGHTGNIGQANYAATKSGIIYEPTTTTLFASPATAATTTRSPTSTTTATVIYKSTTAKYPQSKSERKCKYVASAYATAKWKCK